MKQQEAMRESESAFQFLESAFRKQSVQCANVPINTSIESDANNDPMGVLESSQLQFLLLLSCNYSYSGAVTGYHKTPMDFVLVHRCVCSSSCSAAAAIISHQHQGPGLYPVLQLWHLISIPFKSNPIESNLIL